MKKCSSCNGTGKRIHRISGYVNEYVCETCNGIGYVADNKKK